MSSTPGGLNVFATQQTIITYLENNIGFDVVDGEIPDGTTVKMVNGTVIPYIVTRFSDVLATQNGSSFGGPKSDSYFSQFELIFVGPDGASVRELMSKTNTLLIGWTPDFNSGSITKPFGGGAYDIKGVNSSPSFIVAIAAYRFLTNLATN